MNAPQDIHAIQQTLARFAHALDRKDWTTLAECVSTEVDTDHTDLRHEPAGTMTRERFVQNRRAALAPLFTQHLNGAAEIRIDGDSAHAAVSSLIMRRDGDGGRYDTHCLFEFALERIAGRWTIRSIAQRVLWNDGLPFMHSGMRPATGEG